jgi:hypothetical protein
MVALLGSKSPCSLFMSSKLMFPHKTSPPTCALEIEEGFSSCTSKALLLTGLPRFHGAEVTQRTYRLKPHIFGGGGDKQAAGGQEEGRAWGGGSDRGQLEGHVPAR